MTLSQIIGISPVFAAFSNGIPINTSSTTPWVFKQGNACLEADDIHHVNANGECLAIQTYSAKNQLPTTHPRLLIFIHGDGSPAGGPSDYLKYRATNFVSPNTVSVVMIRPGYHDSYGNYSTGESYAFACNGYPCDGYRPETVATLAAAIAELKKYYHPSCTILVGHSGGAIMSSIILGKYPHIADGAVLASTTYNVKELSQHHPDWGIWTQSLSPDAFINSIPKNTPVDIISGAKDTITYPDLAVKYYTALKNANVDARFISVPNGTHNSIVLTDTTAFDKAIEELLNKCSDKTI